MGSRVGKWKAELKNRKHSWEMGSRVGKWEAELKNGKQSWKIKVISGKTIKKINRIQQMGSGVKNGKQNLNMENSVEKYIFSIDPYLCVS